MNVKVDLRVDVEVGFWICECESGASDSRPSSSKSKVHAPVKVVIAHSIESLFHLNNHTQSYWNNVVPSNTNHYE